MGTCSSSGTWTCSAVLLKRETLEGIAAGRIRLAFRRWRRPTVRAGGELRTAIGVLAIEAVDVVAERDITAAEARAAGYQSRRELSEALGARSGSNLYRVALGFAGADPRAALRAQTDLADGDLAAIGQRLARFDKASRHGAWTETALRLIASSPGVRAPDLAASPISRALTASGPRIGARANRVRDHVRPRPAPASPVAPGGRGCRTATRAPLRRLPPSRPARCLRSP